MSYLISMLQTSSKSINKAFIHSVLFVETKGANSLCRAVRRFCEEKKSVDVEWETSQVRMAKAADDRFSLSRYCA